MQLRAVDWRLILFLTMSIVGAVVLWRASSSAIGSTLGFGFDARAYWGYPRDEVYAGPGISSGYGIYRYSPAFVLIMTLWTAIPWPLFAVVWVMLGAALYVWMVGPWSLALLAIPVFAIELFIGNIHFLLALAVVLGFRWPAAWAFVLLTKVAPGIGLLWFAVRGEWRSLGIALGATGVVVAVSYVMTPGLWLEWVRSMVQTAEPGTTNTIALPLSVRLVVAAILVTWGARTDRRWTVVVAAAISLPVLWANGLAMVAGVVALHRGFPEQLRGHFDWLTTPLRRRMTPALAAGHR